MESSCDRSEPPVDAMFFFATAGAAKVLYYSLLVINLSPVATLYKLCDFFSDEADAALSSINYVFVLLKVDTCSSIVIFWLRTFESEPWHNDDFSVFGCTSCPDMSLTFVSFANISLR